MKEYKRCVRCGRRIKRRQGRRLRKQDKARPSRKRKGHFWDRLCARCQLAIRNR